jgi:hypothetical protein
MYFDSVESILICEQKGRKIRAGLHYFKRLVRTFGKVLRRVRFYANYLSPIKSKGFHRTFMKLHDRLFVRKYYNYEILKR